MIFLNLFRSPKARIKGEGKSFLKQVGMIVLSTTISLFLTLIVLQLLTWQNKKNERHLTAMMVLSNIESFARTLDEKAEEIAFADSLCAWLLDQPLECLDTLPEDYLIALMDQALTENVTAHIEHDHSAEKIFSNDISIWKNLGNFAFIDNVGGSFANINFIEEYYNNWTDEVDAAKYKIYQNSNVFSNYDYGHKLIHDEKIRLYMRNVHERRCWLKYAAAEIRYGNRHNMKAIGIEEDEVIEFTNARTNDKIYDEEAPNDDDYYDSFLKPDGKTGVWNRLTQRTSK